MKKNILLIRTYVSVGTGGPVPPMELLYVVSQINKKLNNYSFKIIDMGIGSLSYEDIKREIEIFKPEIIFLNALIFEAEIVHDIAYIAKNLNKHTIIILIGQLATLAKEYLIYDNNIDFVIVGEPELTSVELLEAIENEINYLEINGLIYKKDKKYVTTEPRRYIENLDDVSISIFSWDLIDIKEYAKYSNWNGALKEEYYMPIITSRGCPFDCTFCCNRDIYGQKFRARSPQNVIDEIKVLHKKYNVKEIHFFDVVFNYDVERAKQICNLIIDSGMNLSLAFPHGIRADIMTDELITLLRKAGAYKITYGVETAVPRLQKLIKKNLDISHVNDVIKKTADTGIIVGGYFMLGFTSETQQEMIQTIDFAVDSDLDIASFFKVTSYKDVIKIYESRFNKKDSERKMSLDFKDLAYFSIKRSHAQINNSVLNNLILKAQRRFYLNFKRLLRGIKKYPHKNIYIKNIISVMGLILQGYIFKYCQKKLVVKKNK